MIELYKLYLTDTRYYIPWKYEKVDNRIYYFSVNRSEHRRVSIIDGNYTITDWEGLSKFDIVEVGLTAMKAMIKSTFTR